MVYTNTPKLLPQENKCSSNKTATVLYKAAPGGEDIKVSVDYTSPNTPHNIKG